MTKGLHTVIYPTTDLDRAKAVFAKLLGSDPTMDEAYYVQFDVAGQEVGLDPNGHQKGMTGPVGYWHVDDIEKAIATVVDAGGEINEPVNDFGGGPRKVASVKDADGNTIGFIQQD
jgi:predicted enzyme related to lactoylglutathione lyase